MILDEDKKLFLKYNNLNTIEYKKDSNLDFLLFNKKIENQKNNKSKWLILLHASYNCNLNCIYCENHALRESYNNAIMSEKLIKDIVQKLGPNIREITWHGGEPLLLPEHYFSLLEEERKKNNLSFKVTLQTNITLLTPKKEELLNKLNILWGTSFDGIDNDQNRGKLSTKKILEYYSNHQGKQQKAGFIAVTTKNSINDLIENYEYYKTLGITAMQSCIVRENVIDGTNPFLVSNDIAVPKVLEYLQYWMYDINNPILDTYLSRQVYRVLGGSTICEDVNCIGGWLTIDPLGNIATCGMSGKDSCFCNINDINDYTDLLTNQKYIKIFDAQRKLLDKACVKTECEWVNSCHGGCMGLNYEQDHSYNTLCERNCNYTKTLLNGVLELIKDLNLSNRDIYNPYFLEILDTCNYYSLSEIKNIEKKYSKE